MNEAERVCVEIRNFQFQPERLSIKANTEVRYVVKGNNSAGLSSLYGSDERFFILYIAEAGKESTPLYAGDFFDHTFTETGSYHVCCFNYVKMSQLVRVGGETELDTTLETEGSEAKRCNQSMSSDQTCLSLQQSSSRFDDISRCLRKIVCQGGGGVEQAFQSLFEKESSQQDSTSNQMSEVAIVDEQKVSLLSELKEGPSSSLSVLANQNHPPAETSPPSITFPSMKSLFEHAGQTYSRQKSYRGKMSLKELYTAQKKYSLRLKFLIMQR